jgi:hypothetical protein
MPTPRHFRPPLDVEEPIRPLARRWRDVAREAREASRHTRHGEQAVPNPNVESRTTLVRRQGRRGAAGRRRERPLA